MKLISVLFLLSSSVCFATGSTGPIQSQCIDPGTTFKNGEWNLISLPCSPEGRSISDLFGSEGFGQYGQNWVLYSFDDSQYTRLPMSEVLTGERGYWLIQRSGADKDYTMPTLSDGFNLTVEADTHAFNRSFAQPLTTRDGLVTWSILGNPVPFKINSSDFVFSCVTDYCRDENGDSWSSLINGSNDVMSGTIYTFENGSYVAMDMTTNQEISPWNGYWAASLVDANSEGLYLGLNIDEDKF